ncbi:MAG: Gfo/Idh/MocA family oxidoreductase [Pseudomonadota bacterium]
MSRPNYRIGLLGASRIAPFAVIQPALRRGDCTLVAIACRDVDRGQAYAAEHGVPDVEIVDSYEALCARGDIDIVYNALPPSRHLDLARAAAGKVQLIEKPFAMNAREAAEIAALPGTIMEAFHHRYHPAFARFLTEVDKVRPLSRMEGRFHVPIPDREGELRHDVSLGGGSLMDLGTYPLQIARTLAGCEPTVTRAEAVEGRPRVDLRMEAELDFGGGLTALISSDMSDGVQPSILFEATGAGGTVSMDNPVHPYMGCRIVTPDGAITNEDHPRWSEVTTYDAQLAHLILCLSMGTPPLTDAGSAVKQMEAIDAIYDRSGLGAR